MWRKRETETFTGGEGSGGIPGVLRTFKYQSVLEMLISSIDSASEYISVPVIILVH